MMKMRLLTVIKQRAQFLRVKKSIGGPSLDVAVGE